MNLNILESYESTSLLKSLDLVKINDAFLVFDSDSHDYVKSIFPHNKIYIAYKIVEDLNLETLFDQSLQLCNEIIIKVNNRIPTDVKAALGVEDINFLQTIFGYKSTYSIFHYKINTILIDIILKSDNFSGINFYCGRSINSSYFDLEHFFKNYFLNKNIPINIFHYENNSNFSYNFQRLRLLSVTKITKKIFDLLKLLLIKIKDIYFLRKQSKKVLVLSGLRYIDVFNTHNFKFIDINKIRIHDKEILDKKLLKSLKETLKIIQLESDYVTNTFFIDDLNENILDYFKYFKFFENHKLINNFKAIFWGLPLIFEPKKSLIVDLAQKYNIDVYGRQHGCSYCTQVDKLHFYSDFDRCSTYFSYGFGHRELKNTYPDYLPRFKIIKSPPKIKNFNKGSREVIDITFPIANSKTEFICEQETIINALIKRNDLNIVIKSISSPDSFFRFNKLIENYPHIKLINNLSFTDYLENYYSKLFVFEVPSTTLDEAINEDSDIILRASRLFPFSSFAEANLSKRAFIYDNNKELYESILKYNPYHPLKLRDKNYFKMYLSNE